MFRFNHSRKGRITLIESPETRGFLIGPLLAEVINKPYLNGIADEQKDEQKAVQQRERAPDHCVISRDPRYTLNQKYDGLTVDTRKIDSKEKAECIRQVMQQLVKLRKSSR